MEAASRTLGERWSLGEKVSRSRFLLLGVTLAAVKYLIDAEVSWAYGQPWNPLMYLSPRVSPLVHPTEAPGYWLSLLGVALPFMIVGLKLCAGRLRDMGARPFWTGLFFAPFVHWAFFLVLAVAPPAERPAPPEPEPAPPADDDELDPPLFPELARLVPESAAARFVLAVVGSLLLTGASFAALVLGPRVNTDLAFASKEVLGVGLFFGVPFGMGFWSGFVVSYRRTPESAGLSLLAALTSFVAGIVLLMAFAFEGVACVIMATPILGTVTVVGAVVGHLVAKLPAPSAGAAIAGALALLLIGHDLVRPPEPVALVETTEIRVAAAPEVVWKNVTAVSPIDEPPAAIFAICAMPLESRLVGEGVGARRTCVLTVGDLEETVEVWDVARELTFRVDRAPARFARYGRVVRGQFLLSRNDDGTTTVRGTTWYELDLAPAAYWSQWTQRFVGAVHERVLDHVKRLSEDPTAVASRSAARLPDWMQTVNATCNCTRHQSGR